MKRALVLGIAIVACQRENRGFHRPIKPDTTMELCAAYDYQPKETGAVVIDRDGKPGDIVTFGGHPYNIHRTDCLQFAGPDLGDARWAVPTVGDKRTYVVIELRGDIRDRLADRVLHRMSQQDAFFVNHTLIAVPLYDSVPHDVLSLANTDPAPQRALFVTLTGVDVPPPLPPSK